MDFSPAEKDCFNAMENIINSVGVIFILAAFLLLTFKKVKHTSVLYNMLNLVGSLLAAIGSYMMWSVPFLALNVAWVGVAVYALTKKKS
jgi:hypothetical protein